MQEIKDLRSFRGWSFCLIQVFSQPQAYNVTAHVLFSIRTCSFGDRDRSTVRGSLHDDVAEFIR